MLPSNPISCWSHMNNYREPDYKKLYYELLQKNIKDDNDINIWYSCLKIEQRRERERKEKERWNKIKPFLIRVGVNLTLACSVVVGFYW